MGGTQLDVFICEIKEFERFQVMFSIGLRADAYRTAFESTYVVEKWKDRGRQSVSALTGCVCKRVRVPVVCQE